jgi:hypothetical protein
MPINPSDISNIGLAGGNPVEAMAQGYKLADLVDQRQMNKMKMQGYQQEMQDAQTLKSLARNYDLSTEEGRTGYAAAATKVDPAKGMEALKAFTEMDTKQNDLAKSQYEVFGKKLELEAQAVAPIWQQASQMQAQGRSQQEIDAALLPSISQTLKTLSQQTLPNGKPVLSQEEITGFSQKLQSGNIKGALDGIMMSHSKGAEWLKMQQQKFGTTKTMTGEQGPGVYQQNSTTGQWTKVGGLAPTAAERGGGAAGGGGAAPLSGNATDLIIDRIKNGESVGDATKGLGPLAKRQVVNRMGELAGQTDENGDPLIDAEMLFNARIEAGALKKATETAGTQAGRLKIAEKELDQFAAPALAASAKVPRGSFVPLNKLNQTIDSAISDPNLREFKMWANSLSNTYDQIAGRGGTDVEKRAEVRDLLSTAPDAESFKRVIDVMRQELKGAEIATAEAMQAGSYRNQENEGGAPKQITTDAEFNALPSGAVFLDPNGKQRRKP